MQIYEIGKADELTYLAQYRYSDEDGQKISRLLAVWNITSRKKGVNTLAGRVRVKFITDAPRHGEIEMRDVGGGWQVMALIKYNVAAKWAKENLREWTASRG
jgi:hypothetical protein